MAVTCTETAECDKWAEIVALAQQGNKKCWGDLQAFDIKLRKIAHTSAYKGFAEDGEQIERIAVVKALENGDSGRISRSCRLLSSVSRIRRSAVNGTPA